MALVYLDVSALYLRWDDALAAVPIPDAEREVELLELDGHDVFVVGSRPEAAAPWAARLRHADEPTADVSRQTPAWLIVGDRNRCVPTRTAGLSTVLVGGGPAPRTGGGRCDMEVTDLHGAVLAVIGGASVASNRGVPANPRASGAVSR